MFGNYKKLVIEVGANNGRDTESFSADSDTMVISFEPSPILYPICVERFKTRPNVLILPIAIDVENSVKPFNVSEQGDKIDVVMDGRCECTYKIPLYTNEDNYYENVMSYLTEKGFQVDIDCVHANDSEIDLHFYRK